MAVDKLVDSTQLDSDLTSVANAIRTKGGTSAQLAFPAEFVSAIEAISGGGGGLETLLASGTHTVTSASSAVTIPTEWTGTARKFFIVKDSITSGVAQMLGWVRFVNQTAYSADFSVFPYIDLGVWCNTSGTKSRGTGAASVPLVAYSTSVSITIRQANSTNNIKPDTYHWYIWGTPA